MLINYYYLTQCLTLTAWWSNPYSLSYWGETWFVERCSDVENVEGQFKVIGGYRGQIRTHCPMEVKLGWWSDIPMPKIVKVNSRSSGVTGVKFVRIVLWKWNLVGGEIFRCRKLWGSIQGHRGHRDQIRTYCPMEVKLGWWKDIPMPKIVKVNSRSSGVNSQIHSDALNCAGQFKVTGIKSIHIVLWKWNFVGEQIFRRRKLSTSIQGHQGSIPKFWIQSANILRAL